MDNIVDVPKAIKGETEPPKPLPPLDKKGEFEKRRIAVEFEAFRKRFSQWNMCLIANHREPPHTMIYGDHAMCVDISYAINQIVKHQNGKSITDRPIG